MKKSVLKIISICIAIVMIFSLCGCGKDKDECLLIKNVKLEESTYKLGDIMGDYTITDINGKSYTFSEVLKDKEAIVLNFWFSNCLPCKNEFPYLQKAADKYSDDIAVFAINPIDTKDEKIEKFVKENKLKLTVVKGDPAWESALQIQGYPTTVIIDRYGKIVFSHIGSITEEGLFEKIFDIYVADDYEQTVINNINELKNQDIKE